MIIECIIVGLGGFIGTILRYLINIIPINEQTVFPIKTFLINIIGSLAIGIITFYINKNITIDENLTLFLKVGICGGFTTFSTFALETGDLIKNGDLLIGLIYIILSVTIGVLAIFISEILLK